MGNSDAGDDVLIEALKYAFLAKELLPEGGNKDLTTVLQGLIAAKLSMSLYDEFIQRVKNWELLFQEEYLASDSPAFAPLNMAELQATQIESAEHACYIGSKCGISRGG